MATLHYSAGYIETAFQIWYAGSRKIGAKFVNSLPEDENGNRPTINTVEMWKNNNGWIERADAMDVELSRTFQKQVIDERVAMYEQHVEVADKLIAKAQEFLDNHPIEDMKDALRAIDLAVTIHQTSVGQADVGRNLLTMSNEQLTKEITKLLKPNVEENEFIIDAEEVDD